MENAKISLTKTNALLDLLTEKEKKMTITSFLAFASYFDNFKM